MTGRVDQLTFHLQLSCDVLFQKNEWILAPGLLQIFGQLLLARANPWSVMFRSYAATAMAQKNGHFLDGNCVQQELYLSNMLKAYCSDFQGLE
jgi:hypothetical protein